MYENFTMGKFFLINFENVRRVVEFETTCFLSLFYIPNIIKKQLEKNHKFQKKNFFFCNICMVG
jgi:hypothetical protein